MFSRLGYLGILEVKRVYLGFCLAAQDMGIGNGDVGVLSRNSGLFLGKLLTKVGQEVSQLLKEANSSPVCVQSDTEFYRNVERFQFDLFDYFQSGKITSMIMKKYPLILPYSFSVVQINELVAEKIG